MQHRDTVGVLYMMYQFPLFSEVFANGWLAWWEHTCKSRKLGAEKLSADTIWREALFVVSAMAADKPRIFNDEEVKHATKFWKTWTGGTAGDYISSFMELPKQ